MKQILLLAVIHLLIFHQYKKDKSEALAPKKYTKPVQAVIDNDNNYLFVKRKITTNEKPDTIKTSVRPVPLRSTHAVYFLPATPAIFK